VRTVQHKKIAERHSKFPPKKGKKPQPVLRSREKKTREEKEKPGQRKRKGKKFVSAEIALGESRKGGIGPVPKMNT